MTMRQKIHRLETNNSREIAILKRHMFANDTVPPAIEAELKAASPSATPTEPRQ